MVTFVDGTCSDETEAKIKNWSKSKPNFVEDQQSFLSNLVEGKDYFDLEENDMCGFSNHKLFSNKKVAEEFAKLSPMVGIEESELEHVSYADTSFIEIEDRYEHDAIVEFEQDQSYGEYRVFGNIITQPVSKEGTNFINEYIELLKEYSTSEEDS